MKNYHALSLIPTFKLMCVFEWFFLQVYLEHHKKFLKKYEFKI
jgi:hypothetical protein